MITTSWQQSKTPASDISTPAATRSRWGLLLLIVGVSFLGCVFSAGCTVRVSYRLAEIEAERVVLNQRQQLLQEQLAAATASDGALEFAHQAGLVQSVPGNAPVLETMRSFASR